jgi:pimeloyl-ACP methyl ester carboxylesterase
VQAWPESMMFGDAERRKNADRGENVYLTCGEHTLTVADGRTLGYSIYGDPAGRPVLNCHGGLVSGRDVSPAHELARTLEICVISPDRPGINHTDRLPGHSLLQWVRMDLVPLLDHLELGPIGVMGWSEGGQYALAAAYELGEGVTGCAIIAGCLPLDDPATFGQLNHLDRAFARLARRAPTVLRYIAMCLRGVAKHWGGALLKSLTRGQPSDEAEAVREQGGWLPETMAEGTANPRGVVDEYLAIVAPWGFSPEEVTTQARIYQGTADTLVPEEWGHLLATRIPNASLVLYPGEGHFIALTRRQDVFEWLVGSARAGGR